MIIPGDVRERLIALADAGEHVWQLVAVMTLDLLDQPGVQKMQVYTDVAACLGMKGSGVRAWCTVYRAVGDDLLVEFPQFRLSHWRLFITASRRLKRPLLDVVMEWAATADDYGGLPVPPDRLAAGLGQSDAEDNRSPFEKAIERACLAVISAQRDCTNDDVLVQLKAIYSDLEQLATQYARRM